MNKIFEELKRISDRNRDHSRSIRDLAMLDLNARLVKLEPSEPAEEGQPEEENRGYWERRAFFWQDESVKHEKDIADLKQQLAQKEAELAAVKADSAPVVFTYKGDEYNVLRDSVLIKFGERWLRGVAYRSQANNNNNLYIREVDDFNEKFSRAHSDSNTNKSDTK